MIIAKVNKDHCILCGICEGLSPNIFKQEETHILVDQQEARSDYDRLLLCVEACPMECIELT